MTTSETAKIVEEASEYKYGFTTDIEQEFATRIVQGFESCKA